MTARFTSKSWLNYSLLLTGGYGTLPLAEVRAILEAEDIAFKILEARNGLLRIKAKTAPIPLKSRSSMVRLCCLELGSGNTQHNEIIKVAKDIDWSIINDKSFSVRVYKYGRVMLTERSPIIEKEIGEVILRSIPNSRVSIKRPEVKVIVLISNESFSIGLLLFERREKISARRPRLRPFFHPSSLDATLARALVNLSRCRFGEVLLDPFVGTGSIIIEAALIGCNAIGVDINTLMVKGCFKNCVFYEVHQVTDVLCSDALIYPLRDCSIDRIVTDPPYGRISSTHGRRSQDLIKGLLDLAQETLRRHGVLVFMHPRDTRLENIVSEYGVKVMEEYEIRIHKGLTRVIKVIKFD